ncbi:cyclic-di-AMP receptor [Fructilactobacillus fructivorans]|uniref:Protein from nitrogen regulatory protein P-II (GLNB) family n=1 Tax=Fructilactobacillus fructivorans TaxID=1614 RepID=A0A0C1Q1L6_9LACO|nr:cyclic-di-AMP receptor [Fructilactobacillus fructivorans]KID41698.1 protein from nitrogen regulatory protein P-II (GLNB) family [Fructilactobacillus fructivorans]KRK57715.1 hypothetical protein FC73_GL000723 [Fructilactobacillus fructivorans]KRN12743.1 hypothetical protein IV37_GL001045 [Fructilactobacillus fructivorans]KRN40593.1 hypothetical protein IV51_GL001214 [Fructilactobacillus fructivorans]KRN43134.1 hypothetical protein IV48_GL000689 [Fructilactobacillus fructivorans]
MKLIIAIVQDKDAAKLQSEFIKHKIQATQLSTKGGFLKAKNVTYLIGAQDDKVDEILDIIKSTCETRKQYMTPPVSLAGSISETSYPVEVQVGGATVMILPMESLNRF